MMTKKRTITQNWVLTLHWALDPGARDLLTLERMAFDSWVLDPLPLTFMAPGPLTLMAFDPIDS